MRSEEVNSINYWNNFYSNTNFTRDNIVYDNWLYSYRDVVDNAGKPIIDLGCGSGNNVKYLMEKNMKVVACDSSIAAIELIKKNFPNIYDTECFDMVEGFPFINGSADLVIADLCLHYFTKEDTIKILSEIKRVLVNQGILLARVYSIDDVDINALNAKEVEKHLYRMPDGRMKRFFAYEDLFEFFNTFQFGNISRYTIDRYGMPKDTYTLKLKNQK